MDEEREHVRRLRAEVESLFCAANAQMRSDGGMSDAAFEKCRLFHVRCSEIAKEIDFDFRTIFASR